METFVLYDLYAALTSYRTATQTIHNLISRSLAQLAIGDLDGSVRSMDIAKDGWEYYMKDKWIDLNSRRQLEPLRIMRRDALIDFLLSPQVPLLHRARLWRNVDLDVRRMTHDYVIAQLTEMCDGNVPPFETAKAFPEPPGMEEYRQSPDAARDRKREDVSEGTRYDP